MDCLFSLTCHSPAQGVVQASPGRAKSQVPRARTGCRCCVDRSTASTKHRGIREHGNSRSVPTIHQYEAGNPRQDRRATIQKNGGHQPNDWQAAYFFNLAIIGSVLCVRLFGVPPVGAGGVVGNISLFHQYMAYTSSGSLRMRCLRGVLRRDVSFSNRHTRDRSGCFFPSTPHAHRSGPVSIFSCGQVRTPLVRGDVTPSQGQGHLLTGCSGVTARSDDRSRDHELSHNAKQTSAHLCISEDERTANRALSLALREETGSL